MHMKRGYFVDRASVSCLEKWPIKSFRINFIGSRPPLKDVSSPEISSVIFIVKGKIFD